MNMKVYVLWSGSGSYEDYMEGVEAIYAEKVDADAALSRAIQEEERRMRHAENCWNCPFLDGQTAGYDYCPYQDEVKKNELGFFNCEYYDGLHEETKYWIKGYEVK